MTQGARTDVRIPRETVNDDVVRIVSWTKADGTRVSRGTMLAEIETSKAEVEVVAEAEGVLRILKVAQTDVPIGEPIGFIESEGASGTTASARAAPAAGSSAEPLASAEATALMQANGLKAADFSGHDMITADLVRKRVAPVAAAAITPREAVISQTLSSAEDPSLLFKAARERWAARGRRGLAVDAAASAQHRGKSLFWLAANYAWRNWFLGLLVRAAPRGINLAIHRLRGVKIGSDCFVDPTATLETAYPERIQIGVDVRIAAGAVLMTHIKAPNLLRESGAVPTVDAGITLRDHCFIGVNACVMPGVTIGEGAVVASGSLVLKDVPAYSMVAGNPAQVVKTLRPKE